MIEKKQLLEFIDCIVTNEDLEGLVTNEKMNEFCEKLVGRMDVQQGQLDGLQALLGSMQVKITQMQLQIVKLEEQLALKDAAIKENEPIEVKPAVQEDEKAVMPEKVESVAENVLASCKQQPAAEKVERTCDDVKHERVDVHVVQQTIAESIKGEESLGDQLSKKVEQETVASSLNASKIERMQTAITIADRFRFQRELFEGDAVKMAETVEMMNGMKTLDEALSYLDKHFGWDNESQAAIDFIKIVERRF